MKCLINNVNNTTQVMIRSDLCWTLAFQQTEPVLLWAPRMEGSQELPTSQLAGRPLPGPSSQADWGTHQDSDCKMVAEHGSLAVAGEGNFHTLEVAVLLHKVVDYRF